MEYGFSKKIDISFEEAVGKVTEELIKEGFGILTTINVQEILKKKLNVDFKKYIILGACNPPLAYKALNIDEQIGLFLPCNVVVCETDGKTEVSLFNPMVMTEITRNEEIRSVAAELTPRLHRVLAAL